jgi:arsenate reductase-like glutaredoxin family protein
LAEIKKRNGLPADFSSATREQQIRSGAFSEADKKYGKSINSDQNDKKASGGTRTKLANPKYNVGTGYVDENGNEFYIKDWFFDKAGEKDFYKVESISEDIGTNKEDTVEVDVVDRRLRSGDYQGKELAWHDAHAGRHPEGHISKEELARVDSARKDYHQERFSKKDEAAAARATPETPTDASKEQAEGEAPPASPPVGGPSEGAPPAAAGASEEQAAAPADPVEEAAKETETEVTPEGVAEEGVAAEEVPGEEEVATEEVTDDIADAAPLAGDEADPEVEDAEAVEEVAQEEAPRREDLGGSEGDSVDLHLTAGKSKIDKHPVQYRVVEADSITPSHKVSAGKFIKHENYPEGVQPRKYSGDDAKGVLERADNYEPGQVMSLDVGPNSGPPIVTKDGIVLGGNSRTMTKQHMYATGRGDTIRDHLMKNAEKFGVDPATIEGMNNPVLVRQMSDVHSQDMSPEDLNKLASQMNQSEAMAMTSEESATDLAKHLDKSEVLDKLAEDFDIDDHKTLNKFQESSDGQEFLTKFAEALGNKAPAYLEHNGRLSDTGRRAVNRAIGAHLVGDKEVFGRLEEKPKNKLSAIAFPSMLISKHPSAHDLGKDLKTAANAIDAIARYRDTLDDKGRKDFNRLTDDDKLDTMMSQGDLLDPDHPIGDNPRARALYNLIQNENQTDLKKTFEKMASSVKGTGAAQQDDMFAASPGPEAPKTTEELLSQAYQDATGRVLANEYQNTETGEDSYWGPPTEPEPEEVETEAAEVETPTEDAEAEVAETPTEDAEAEVAETPTEDVAEAAEVEEVPTPEGEDVAEEAEVAEWSPAEKPTARTLGSINGVLGDSSPYSDVSNASKWDHHTNVEKAHKFTSPDGGVTVTGKGRKYTISGHGEESTATSMKAALTAAKALHDKMNVQADDMHKGGGEATKEDRDFLGDILGDSGTGCI